MRPGAAVKTDADGLLCSARLRLSSDLLVGTLRRGRVRAQLCKFLQCHSPLYLRGMLSVFTNGAHERCRHYLGIAGQLPGLSRTIVEVIGDGDQRPDNM